MDKIIISDTSCLIALQRIGLLHLLKDLFQEVLITPEVKNEFEYDLPEWILVSEVKNKEKQSELEKKLDKGESSSIALALERKDSLLIIDEIKGRKIAASLKIEIIGTVGIILLADKRGLIKDVFSVIQKLTDEGFRLSDKIIDRLKEKYHKR